VVSDATPKVYHVVSLMASPKVSLKVYHEAYHEIDHEVDHEVFLMASLMAFLKASLGASLNAFPILSLRLFLKAYAFLQHEQLVSLKAFHFLFHDDHSFSFLHQLL
jgi:hypothetical protein